MLITKEKKKTHFFEKFFHNCAIYEISVKAENKKIYALMHRDSVELKYFQACSKDMECIKTIISFEQFINGKGMDTRLVSGLFYTCNCETDFLHLGISYQQCPRCNCKRSESKIPNITDYFDWGNVVDFDQILDTKNLEIDTDDDE